MRKIGLFVGIDHYRDKEISSLTCAAKDARELASVFKHKLYYETIVLTHEELGKGRSINGTLHDIYEKLGNGGTFVFYFAGHGNTYIDADKKDQLFLLPDVFAKNLSQRKLIGVDVISYNSLRTEIDGWKNVQAAYILDVCRSPLLQKDKNGRGADDFGLFKGETAFRDAGTRAVGATHIETEYVLLNACHDDQRAVELSTYQDGHGLFTASLLETLNEYHIDRKPIIINSTFTDIINARMKKLALDFVGPDTEQSPLKIGADLKLYSHHDEMCAKLVVNFEAQLAVNKLDKPFGDNCQHTLHLLLAKEYDHDHQQILNAKLQAKLDLRETEQMALRDKKRFDAAVKLGTGLAYSNYLATCELCIDREKAEAAIENEKMDQREQVRRQAEIEEKIIAISQVLDANQMPPDKSTNRKSVSLDVAAKMLAGKNILES